MLGSAPMWRRRLRHGVLAVTAALNWCLAGPVAGAQDGRAVSAEPLLSVGVGPGREPVPTGYAATIREPQDFDTIQAAVDHARPGGMVVIAPGIYSESVTVTTPYVTIRGLDRDRTIIDGGFERAHGIQVFAAAGVAIENLTSRHHVLDGYSRNVARCSWARYIPSCE